MWQRFKYYLQLIRFGKPIGTYLLLWPALSALWLASGGVPQYKWIIIFVLGALVMRSAGCIINDFADRHVDNKVKRTKDRPLTSGKVSVMEAAILFVILLCGALWLVLQLNMLCFYISCLSLLFTVIYPFTKRFVHAPQLFLGFAYASAVPMAFAAVKNAVPTEGWWFYLAALIWPIAYDTMYALVDKDDDLNVGIKSTAIWFGNYDRLVIGLLQIVSLCICVYVGSQLNLSWVYYMGLMGAAILFCYQQWLIKDRVRQKCLQAFLNNHWALLSVLLGVVFSF